MNIQGNRFEALSVSRANAPSAASMRSFEADGVTVCHAGTDPVWLERVIASLRHAAEGLAQRSSGDVAATLGGVGARFLDPHDPLRAEALRLLPGTSGLSPAMAALVLDGMASDWTADRLELLLAHEDLPLDGFADRGPAALRPAEHRLAEPARSLALGPRLCTQIVSGSVPGVSVTAIVRSLLAKGPTLVKPGRGDVVLPVLFAGALREADPELAEAVAVVYWPGGSTSMEDVALASADVVTAYGSDASVAELRARTPLTTRFIPYHHRVSVGVVGRDALTPESVGRAAADVAGAVAAFDQRGCVSPQVVWIEDAGATLPSEFARMVAAELARIESALPGGRLDVEEGSALHQMRGTVELLAASGAGVEVHHGGRASWTVVYEPDPRFAPGCVGRVVRVKPLHDLDDLEGLLAPLGGHLQTVGACGLGDRLEGLAERLGRIGASRIVGFDSVPFPPPWWHHDGGGPVRDLVRWVDLG